MINASCPERKSYVLKDGKRTEEEFMPCLLSKCNYFYCDTEKWYWIFNCRLRKTELFSLHRGDDFDWGLSDDEALEKAIKSKKIFGLPIKRRKHTTAMDI